MLVVHIADADWVLLPQLKARGISSYMVIATSEAVVKPSEVATRHIDGGWLARFMVGMLLMVPSYLVAIVGSLIRSLLSQRGYVHRKKRTA